MISQQKWKRIIGNKLSPKLAQEVFSATTQEKMQVIMEFPYLRSCRSKRIRELIFKAGGNIVYELPLINSLAVELPSDALFTLIPAVKVKMVWPDVKATPCLDVAVPATGANQAHQEGINGQGVVVAILDTGIDPHVDLTTPVSRIIGWHDLVNQKTEPYDDEGHGTHVAGIIAGNGHQADGKYMGMAPAALLVGVKVLDEKGSGPISRVIAGIQWVVNHKEELRIKAINLSLGAPAEEGYRTDPASKAVNAAWKAGILVCAAAGNFGPKRRTITTPGIAPSVITVGSINDQGTIPRIDDVINDFSSRGPTIDRLLKPDLVAPGHEINSLQVGGGYLAHSGTSMATPMVTGAAALIWQKAPHLTPDQIKKILVSTAEDRGYNKLIQGAGYLNVAEALQQVNTEEPEKTVFNEDLFFTFLVAGGLKFAKGEIKQELLSVLANHVGKWVQSSGRFQKEDKNLYHNQIPDVLRALGEWLL